MSERPLRIILTFDTDHDLHLDGSSEVSWYGLDEIERISYELRQFSDTWGNEARAVWFVRHDLHVKVHQSRADWMLTQHETRWRALQMACDELGWHPHCHAGGGEQDRPEPDEQEIIEQLRRCSPMGKDHEWFRPTSVRMGFGLMSNAILDELERQGLRIDASALPGRHEEGVLKDWRGAPSRPYLPSISDYRKEGIPSRDILEVPTSTAKIRLLHEHEGKSRVFSLAYHPRLLCEPIREWISTAEVMVFTTHLWEFSRRLAPSTPNALISFDYAALRENLTNVLDACREVGRAVSFITMRELLEGEYANTH